MSKIKEFTVNRTSWCRGDKNGDSRLFNSDGYMCCLGFLGQACGLAEKDMLEVGLPHHENHTKIKYPLISLKWEDFASINDNPKICDNTREKKLRKLFKEIGITIHFAGKEK